mgnify:CR=1 FL=1
MAFVVVPQQMVRKMAEYFLEWDMLPPGDGDLSFSICACTVPVHWVWNLSNSACLLVGCSLPCSLALWLLVCVLITFHKKGKVLFDDAGFCKFLQQQQQQHGLETAEWLSSLIRRVFKEHSLPNSALRDAGVMNQVANMLTKYPACKAKREYVLLLLWFLCGSTESRYRMHRASLHLTCSVLRWIV